jgi:RHS repeat-associated protein
MTTFASANTETWNYNAKGEVVAADHSTNNAFDRSFQFDGIGNRKKSADSLTLPATDNYTSNALNQYSAVGVVARTYDTDGNITDNGERLYVWDAENRLIAVKQGTVTVTEYAYDSYSRRITKDVAGTVTNFVYDGWNPIAEFTGNTLSKSYVWGMDVSGSMQGAGGVGGLLAVNEAAATHYPIMDGNGNISEYLGSTGTVVAHYEYDTFGQAIASGSKKDDFSHQFSTKQLDAETGLNYYGYRYYDSSNGRWLSRDPLEEDGGINLYGFVGNDSIGGADYLGLQITPTEYDYVDVSVEETEHDSIDGVRSIGGDDWFGSTEAGTKIGIPDIVNAGRSKDFKLCCVKYTKVKNSKIKITTHIPSSNKGFEKLVTKRGIREIKSHEERRQKVIDYAGAIYEDLHKEHASHINEKVCRSNYTKARNALKTWLYASADLVSAEFSDYTSKNGAVIDAENWVHGHRFTPRGGYVVPFDHYINIKPIKKWNGDINYPAFP